MENLLNEVLHAAGGMDIWKKYSTLTAQIKINGVKSWLESDPNLLDNLIFQADLSGQNAQLRNFPQKGLYTIFTNDDATVFDQKDNEVTDFDPAWKTLFDPALKIPWHAIQMMYFIKYTFWKSITFPFSLTAEEYECEPSQLFHDNSRLFKTLLVQSQKRTPYGTMMTLFFNEDNLLARTDYETQDDEPVLFTKTSSNYAVLNGLIIPTLIQIFYRKNDGTYDIESPLVSFEVKSMKFI